MKMVETQRCTKKIIQRLRKKKSASKPSREVKHFSTCVNEIDLKNKIVLKY